MTNLPQPSLRLDKGQLFRYAITGVSVAALYACLQLMLNARFGISRANASLAALGVALIFQYFMHSLFTFQGNWQNAPQLGRFIATILIGFGLSHIIMVYLGPALALPNLICVGLVITILPIANFVLFSLWVFTTGQNTDTPAAD